MLDLYSNEQKVYLADYNVFQMISSCFVSLSSSFPILRTYFDLLYSNSICKQSSIPTSIFIELLLSGGMRNECTQISRSFTTSAILRDIVTRTKYLHAMGKKGRRTAGASRKNNFWMSQVSVHRLLTLASRWYLGNSRIASRRFWSWNQTSGLVASRQVQQALGKWRETRGGVPYHRIAL